MTSEMNNDMHGEENHTFDDQETGIQELQVNDRVNDHIIEKKVMNNSGFGTVYRAYHQRLNAYHAIKQLRPNRRQYRNAFLGESQRAKKIGSNHPNIVNITDLIKHPKFGDLLIMDWIDGETLLHWRHNNDTPDMNVLMPIAFDIIGALETVHQYFSHNDIKPDNIMITPQGRAILIDFGLAYQDGDDQSHLVNHGVKTTAFAAPEILNRIRKKQVTSNKDRMLSDIFSLGTVLYYLFTGKHYLGLSMAQIQQHGDTQFILTSLQQTPIRPMENCPEDLTNLVMKMLSLIPAERPPSMTQILKDLKRIHADLNQAEGVSSNIARDIMTVDMPYLLVGTIVDDSVLQSTQIPMQLDTTTLRPIYHARVYAAPIQGETILQVNYQGVQYSSRAILGGQGSHTIFFGEDAQGAWHISTEQEKLHLVTPIPPPTHINLSRHHKTQLAVILDGRLTAESLDTAGYIVDELVRSAENSFALDVAIVLYGAYPHLKQDAGSQWASPYHLQATDFDQYQDTQRLASYYLAQAPIDFSGIGYCGALGYALHHSFNALSWDDNASQHILLMGSAPPHPTQQDRRRFDLLDFSIDEFDLDRLQITPAMIDWRTQHQQHLPKIHISTGFLEPHYRIKPIHAYVEEVWRTLDADNLFNVPNEDYPIEAFKDLLIRRITKTQKTVILPQQPYPFPLLHPLKALL